MPKSSNSNKGKGGNAAGNMTQARQAVGAFITSRGLKGDLSDRLGIPKDYVKVVVAKSGNIKVNAYGSSVWKPKRDPGSVLDEMLPGYSRSGRNVNLGREHRTLLGGTAGSTTYTYVKK